MKTEGAKKSSQLMFATIKTLSGFFLLTTLIACSPNLSTPIDSSKTIDTDNSGIIGGTTVSKRDVLTHSVVSIYDTALGALCTGSVLAPDIVVTAAHCARQLPKALVVMAGTNAKLAMQMGDAISVQNVLLATPDLATCPTLDPGLAKDPAKEAAAEDTRIDCGDIAILKLTKPLPASMVPAVLLEDSSLLAQGTSVTLAGFGITNGVTHSGSGVLRKTSVTVEEPMHGATEIVFRQTQGTGACHGDSGGPAFALVNGKYQLFGVTSRGYKDLQNDCTHFAIYTNLVPYKKFIADGVAFLQKGQQANLVFHGAL